MQFLIIMALDAGVMYVLMIRPQRQRQAQQQTTIENAGVGDDIVTTGGIYGTITRRTATTSSSRSRKGVTVHMTRRGIAAVLPPEEEDEAYEEREDERGRRGAVHDGDGDEGAVTDGEEAVRSAAGEASSGDGPPLT